MPHEASENVKVRDDGQPTTSPREAVTKLLHAAASDDPQAAEALLPLVYDQLRHLAGRHLGREGHANTLQPTALVHEAYIRLVGHENDEPIDWKNRGHFFGAAAEAMRRILIDRARRRLAEKHGGGRKPVQLPDVAGSNDDQSTKLLALHDALTQFEHVDPERAGLVKLRHFGGLTQDQAADALGISRATAARHWAFARAWLFDFMTRQQCDER